MRLRIRHTTRYRFDAPARNVTQILRLTPRSHEGQHVIGWRIDVDTDCTLKADEDGFGNITHRFTVRGPCEDLTVSAGGEIENFDTTGLVRGSAERLPTQLYLRHTPLTTADAPLRSFADAAVAGRTADRDKLDALLECVHGCMTFDGGKPDAASIGEAFAAKRGNGQDFAHVLIACARHLGFPSRFIGGYYHAGQDQQGLRHAWSEIHVAGTGWVGFDPVFGVRPHEAHVRVSTGLDGLSAAPVRATQTETFTESLDIGAP